MTDQTSAGITARTRNYGCSYLSGPFRFSLNSLAAKPFRHCFLPYLSISTGQRHVTCIVVGLDSKFYSGSTETLACTTARSERS